MYDIIIIGGGVSGIAAAIYSARFNLKTLILSQETGGLIQYTHLVENYPGYKSISGPQLADKFKEHVDDYKDLVDIKEEPAVDIEKKNSIFKVKTKKSSYEGKTILIATGTRRKELNAKGEKEFKNRGVSYCAVCDATFTKNKIVGVVGGSDSAAKEALLLSEYAKKVYIIYRKEKIRAEPINQKRIGKKIKEGKIEIINNTNVLEVKGDKVLTHVIFDKLYKNNKEFKLDFLFIEIGHIVESSLAKKLGVKLDEKEQVIIDKYSRTNIEGVYAAGDVTDREFKQAITGVAEGCIAANEAYEYINKMR